MKPLACRLLVVALLALAPLPARAEAAFIGAFAAAAKVLVLAIPVAVVGYLVFKAAGGDRKPEPAGETAGEKKEKPPAEPAK